MLKMNKICRICLEGGVLTSVFTKNYNISLSDMIEHCSKVKVQENDGMPEHICSNCVYKLGIAYHFKQTCESSDIRLKQYLGLTVTDKSKDVGVMTDPVVAQTTIIKNCKCKLIKPKKTSSNYKKKPESEKLRRGPKPKPKQVHSCYQCQKEFRCQAQLEMHVRTHTGDKPFTCMYCPRRFTQKYNLTIHLRVHTGEKPFQCEVCSKRFSAQSNLQAHLKIHTGQKDHVCSLCNKTFVTSSELTRHMYKHRGVKNFKCDICGNAYTHSRNLKLHKIKKHQAQSQTSQTQNEGFNNSHIDIIGLDDGKEIQTLPTKNMDHDYISQPHNEKNHQSLTTPEQSFSLYDHRGLKDIFQICPNKNNETFNCPICGESFMFLSVLVQHCLHHHKGFDPTQPKNFS